jgi:hypothetical protein
MRLHMLTVFGIPILLLERLNIVRVVKKWCIVMMMVRGMFLFAQKKM